MRSAWRGPARILMAVVALGGLARAVLAAPSSVPLSASQARWMEIRIVLDLLADEATFTGSCMVHVHNGQIEITGVLPSEAARARAVQIASQFGTLPVRDGLAIQRRPAVALVNQERVAELATQQLHNRLGEQAKCIEVLVRDNNRVVLHGSVDSYEEKLAIGQLVRTVAGCKSIQNDLQVTAVAEADRSYQRVTSDGKLIVAAGPAVTVPVSHAAVVPEPNVVSTPVQRPGPVIYKVQSYPRLPANLVKPDSAPAIAAAAPEKAPQAMRVGQTSAVVVLSGPDVSAATPPRAPVTPYMSQAVSEPRPVCVAQANKGFDKPAPTTEGPTPYLPLALPEHGSVPVKPSDKPLVTPTARPDPFAPSPIQVIRKLPDPVPPPEWPRATMAQAPDKAPPAPNAPALYKPSALPDRPNAPVNQGQKAATTPATRPELPVLASTQVAGKPEYPLAASMYPAPTVVQTDKTMPAVPAQPVRALARPPSWPERTALTPTTVNMPSAGTSAPSAVPVSSTQAKTPDKPKPAAFAPAFATTQTSTAPNSTSVPNRTPAASTTPATGTTTAPPNRKPVVVAQAGSPVSAWAGQDGKTTAASLSSNGPAAGSTTPLTRPVPAPAGAALSTYQVPQQKPTDGLSPRMLPFGAAAALSTGSQTATVTTVSPTRTVMAAPASTPVVTVSQVCSAPVNVNHKPYVANGVMIFDEEIKPPAPAMANVAQADLKNRVLAVTTGKSRSVDVVTGVDRITRIQVTVSTAALEREVHEKIMRFPELHSGSVTLETIVSP